MGRAYGMMIFASILAIAGCTSDMPAADRAELGNIAPWNVVPKSSPAQLVQTFDRFCMRADTSPQAFEALARDASYVPANAYRVGAARVYLVDDRRPAIAVTDTMCLVRAAPRTGQADSVQDYVAETYPDATPLAPASFGAGIERAWQLRIPGDAVIATRRLLDVNIDPVYEVILFRPHADKRPKP